jgi:peroxiredoxin
MKKFSTQFRILVAAAAVPAIVLAGCAKKGAPEKPEGGFRISGHTDKIDTAAWIYLVEADRGRTVRRMDSTKMNQEGNFYFVGKVEEPLLGRLHLYNTPPQYFIVENTDIKVTAEGDKRQLKVAGGEEQKSFERLEQLKAIANTTAREYDQQARDLMASAKTKEGQQVVEQQLNNKFYILKSQMEERAKRFGDSLKPSVVLYLVAGSLDPKIHLPYLDSLTKRFKMQNPDSRYTRVLMDQLNSASVVAKGAVAPEITSTTPEGKQFSLSSLKGQYVLIDFWASWCGPCRRQNPDVVKLYNKYKDKGFTILSVSLDSDRQKWLDAIAKDGLTWHHVSDLQKWEAAAARTYQVNEIPQTFLLDKEGKIVDRNLTPEQLDVKLAGVL